MASLHQPSSRILNLFDKILILAQGSLVYDGSPQLIQKRIEELNITNSFHKPPLDLFMEEVDIDSARIELFKKDTQHLSRAEFDQQVELIYQKKINSMVEL